MHPWHELVSAGLPDEITTVGRDCQFPPIPELPELIRGKSFTAVQAAYVGGERDGADLIRPLTNLAMDPDQPLPCVASSRLVADASSAMIDAFLDAAGPGSGSGLASVELCSMGGALARRTPAHGARATLAGDYTIFAVGGVMTPDGYDDVLAQADGVPRRSRPGTPARANPNLAEGAVDARLFYDADTWRLPRALRTHCDPNGLFLANHELKDSKP